MKTITGSCEHCFNECSQGNSMGLLHLHVVTVTVCKEILHKITLLQQFTRTVPYTVTPIPACSAYC